MRSLFRLCLCVKKGTHAALAVSLVACASAVVEEHVSKGPQSSFTREISPFPVLDENGRPYEYPFLGGFDVPRPQFIDIDADSDFDLFVQERSHELIFFENTGTATSARFVWRTDKYQNLDIGEWNRFVDLDADGDFDLLAEEPFSYIRFYRNRGTAQNAVFELAADSLRDGQGRAIFADRQNIPNLADIDCDGLIDLFLGRVEGTITRYEAAGAGGRIVPRFQFVTDRFEDISIVAQIGGSDASAPERSRPEAARPYLRAAGSLHGANTMFWADVEQDGDLDLFWGDFFEPGVLLIENVGANCQTPNLRVEPRPLLLNGTKLETSGYNVPVLVDIDGDNDRDLFIGVLGGAYNPNRTAANNFYFLERTPQGDLTLRSTRFLQGIDVGSESTLALGDLDGDNDLDMLVANKLDPGNNATSHLYLFSNTGSTAQPQFGLADRIELANNFHYAPALADLDNDDDLDLLLGTWNDGVQIYRNTGSRTQPQFTQDTAATLRFSRGSHFTPALADIDGDGDLDLFVGEASGELNFLRNQSGRFVLESEQFQNVDAGRRGAPALSDLDGDGDYDLILGSEAGGVIVYRNQGTRREPRFLRDSTYALPLHHLATPVFADIDGDGDRDLFTGLLSGGIAFWRRR